MADEVRFGFVGAGWIAQRALAPAVHAADGAVLQAVAARDAERARSLEPAGRDYGGAGAYQALLDDPDVDVVYVCLSNESHLPWARAALAAGKHVLCEKPLGLSAAEVAELVSAAQAADRLLVEAFWYRWHPRTRRLEALLAAGDLGPVRRVETDFSFDGRGEPRVAANYRLDPARGGGALYDVGCYAVSAAHLALGPDLAVTRAWADVGPSGVDLSAEARLRAPGGGEAVARCGIAVPDRQVLRMSSDAVTAEFTTADGIPGETFTSWHSPSRLVLTGTGGVRRHEDFPPVDPYRLMVEAVAARVRGEDAFLVGLDHSAEVAATLDAVRAAT